MEMQDRIWCRVEQGEHSKLRGQRIKSRYRSFIFLFIATTFSFSLSAQTADTTFNEHLIPYENVAGKWGYLNAETGKIAITPKYEWVSLFQHGIAKVSVYNPKGKDAYSQSLYGWIDTTGREIFKPQFIGVYKVGINGGVGLTIKKGEQLPKLREVTTQNGQSGIISLPQGSWLVEPGKYSQFYFYDSLHILADQKYFIADGVTRTVPDDYIIVRADLKHRLFYIEQKGLALKGLATWDGMVLVPPKYLDLRYLSATGHILANRLKDSSIFKKLHEIQQQGKSSNKKVNDTLKQAALKLVKKLYESNTVLVELLDSGGKELAHFTSQYQATVQNDSVGSYQLGDNSAYFSLKDGSALPFGQQQVVDGYQVFVHNGLYGLKDSIGNVILPPSYKELTIYRADFILAAKAVKGKLLRQYGVITIDGTEVIPFDYDRLWYYPQKHWLAAEKNEKYGLINEAAKVLVGFKYDSQFFFENGLAQVYADGKCGVIDTSGTWIVPPEFNSINHENVAGGTDSVYFMVEDTAGVWGMLDKSGEVILPIQYGYINFLHEGANQDGWVSLENKTRSENGLYNVRTGALIAPVYNVFHVYNDIIIAATYADNGYKYQLLNQNGDFLSDASFTRMDKKYQYILAEKDGKCGVLSTDGRILIPFQYHYIWSKSAHLVMVEKDGHYFYVSTEGYLYSLK